MILNESNIRNIEYWLEQESFDVPEVKTILFYPSENRYLVTFSEDYPNSFDVQDGYSVPRTVYASFDYAATHSPRVAVEYDEIPNPMAKEVMIYHQDKFFEFEA